jgi:hypothetical protein
VLFPQIFKSLACEEILPRFNTALDIIKNFVVLRRLSLCPLKTVVLANKVKPQEMSLPVKFLKNGVIIENSLSRLGVQFLRYAGIPSEGHLTDIHNECVSIRYSKDSGHDILAHYLANVVFENGTVCMSHNLIAPEIIERPCRYYISPYSKVRKSGPQGGNILFNASPAPLRKM